jgi:threonine/homoserine/homoserine lactone efflux protein
MKNSLGVLLFTLGLLYLLYLAFIVWLKPRQYMEHIHERRARLKSQIPFLPGWLIGFIFFYEQPQFSVWWARIGVSIAVLICVLGIIASVHGPF